jgi:hypothetical protein
MIVHAKKEFFKAVVMMVSFLIILILMFSQIFGGKNAFEAADIFFNSIAKGSTYYIPGLLKQADAHSGKAVEASIKLGDKESAAKVGKLLSAAGASASVADTQLKSRGDLGKITRAALQDADDMFHNRGKAVSDRYGLPEKEVLFLWWSAFKEMEKDLKRQNRFNEAAWLSTVSKKGMEVGYNFYQIEPRKASATAGMLTFSLIFYVAYTMWWGFAILFLFEGLGLEMKPGAKKEV